MSHDAARLQIGAEPRSVPPELAEHLAGCPACSRFQREMVDLDNNIRRALDQSPSSVTLDKQTATPVAPGGTPVVSLIKARTQRRKVNIGSGWAIAASVALLAILATWSFRPNDSLAHEVVHHVQLEPNSWASDTPVAPEDLKQVLANAGIELDMSSDKIMYAHSCLFRGHVVPHLVVSTPQGHVTVLILRYESVKHRMDFNEDGMSGVITPASHGSIAVLMQGNANIDAIAQQVEQSVHWT